MHRNPSVVLPGLALAAMLAMILLPPDAVAQNYHPLDIGSQWEYYSAVLGTQTMTIVGDIVVLGTTTRLRHQEEPDQVYENFWTSDPDGNLYLHGARNITYPFEVAFLPPIQMVNAPLSLGKTWTTYGILSYDLDGTPWGDDPFDYPLRVYTEGTMEVPAGEFYAYGVGFDSGPTGILTTSQGSFDVFGRRLADVDQRPDNPQNWYSIDVGLVQIRYYTYPDYDYRLVSYQLPPVPVEFTTWGAIKALFGSR